MCPAIQGIFSAIVVNNTPEATHLGRCHLPKFDCTGQELQAPGLDAHQAVSVASATSSYPRFRPKAVVGAYCVYAYALYRTVLLFAIRLILDET